MRFTESNKNFTEFAFYPSSLAEAESTYPPSLALGWRRGWVKFSSLRDARSETSATKQSTLSSSLRDFTK
ncbi:hypothetical protein [Helicobacter sp. 23-1045]